MDAEWRLFADLADRAGDDRVTVSVDADATVGDALDALVDAHPDVRERLRPDGDARLAPDIAVLRDGTDLRAGATGADDLDQPVAADDDLALLPAISGG
jgi:molybdopterin synthase sulfur carrier subunit